ncbi:pectate lyase [Ignavibacteria bacterium 4148-Me]|uniref:pectate lyase n=1 Tax=Rosettibacter primus TaxID=3111523 RepID=UPI00336BC4ED
MKKILFTLIVNISILYAQNSYIKKFPDVSGFQNSAHHWYDIYAEDNVIHPLPERPRYKPENVKEIADNILLYQKENGGWPKNYDMLAILTEEQKDSLRKTKNQLNTTFDNWTTHTQVEYLAQAYYLIHDEKYKEACLKGIDYILSAQYPNGGWPQYYPDTSGYRKYITFNDGVMIGIMKVLYNIVQNKPHYSFVDNLRREKVKAAFEKGLECILKTQINDNGKLTAWPQQADNVGLFPQWARAFEPPCICNGESAEVVLFLMNIENPSNEIINAIQSAVRWFEDSKIKGIKIVEKKIEPKKYYYSTFDYDRIVVEDSTAPPIWTRYYELKTHKPIFCNRNKKIVYTLAEVEHERRAGYSWYTYAPQEVLNKYTEWQKKYAPNENVLQKR